MRRFLRICVIVALFTTACSGGDVTPTRPTEATSQPSVPTTMPVTTLPDTTLPDATLPDTTTIPAATPTVPVPILLAHDDGIDIVGPEGKVVVERGRPIGVAIPDLRGGVIFQEWGQFEVGWPPEPVPIEWIVQPGREPVVLVDGSGWNALTPIQVAWIEGQPHLIYERMVVEDEDDQTSYLVVLNLDSGAEVTLGIIGAYESSDTRIQVAAGLVAWTWQAYADSGACAGVTDLTTLFGGSEDAWIGKQCAGACCRFGPNPGCGHGTPCYAENSVDTMRAVLTPDGHTVVMVVSGSGANEPPTSHTVLTELDLRGSERRSIELDVGADARVSGVDSDGSLILMTTLSVAGDVADEVVLVHPNDAIDRIGPANSAFFWKEVPAALPRLSEDGLGDVVFGDDAGGAMDRLVEMLGRPDEESMDMPPDTHAPGSVGVRSARWDELGLAVVFADWGGSCETPFEDRVVGIDAVRGWRVDGYSPLLTVDGVGPGSSIDVLRSAYGRRLILSGGDCPGQGFCSFAVSPAGGPRSLPMAGTFHSAGEYSRDIVWNLRAGIDYPCEDGT